MYKTTFIISFHHPKTGLFTESSRAFMGKSPKKVVGAVLKHTTKFYMLHDIELCLERLQLSQTGPNGVEMWKFEHIPGSVHNHHVPEDIWEQMLWLVNHKQPRELNRSRLRREFRLIEAA